MMPHRRIEIDLDRVRELVNGGATMSDLAFEFSCSTRTVRAFLQEHGLEAARKYTGVSLDPTPDEIEMRKRECREKHLAARRREPWEATLALMSADGHAVET